MRLLTILLLFILSFASVAKPTQIVNMRVFKPALHQLRLVFSLSAPVSHNIFTLKYPNRLVIDFRNTKLVKKLRRAEVDALIIKNIRSAKRNKKDLRVVLDLNVPVRTKSFRLKPDGSNGHRLVVDINTLKRYQKSVSVKLKKPAKTGRQKPDVNTLKQYQKPVSVKPKKPAKTGRQKPNISPPPVVTTYQHASNGTMRKRDIIVAIDPGHGGIDSGAIGIGGTEEKDIVLSIAKKLATMVVGEPGMRVILIRNGDYFVKLRKRIELARQYQADLFISIHADAYPDNENVQGSSVYMLSRRGASSEAARWLAAKENSADLIGGVSLSDKDDLLASVLLNLSQAGTLKASAIVGKKIVKNLKKIGKSHSNRVQRAGFMVLRSPDIPSILIETGFISNPLEERKLKLSDYQTRIAVAIMKGIREYFANHAESSTQLVRR